MAAADDIRLGIRPPVAVQRAGGGVGVAAAAGGRALAVPRLPPAVLRRSALAFGIGRRQAAPGELRYADVLPWLPLSTRACVGRSGHRAALLLRPLWSCVGAIVSLSTRPPSAVAQPPVLQLPRDVWDVILDFVESVPVSHTCRRLQRTLADRYVRLRSVELQLVDRLAACPARLRALHVSLRFVQSDWLCYHVDVPKAPCKGTPCLHTLSVHVYALSKCSHNPTLRIAALIHAPNLRNLLLDLDLRNTGIVVLKRFIPQLQSFPRLRALTLKIAIDDTMCVVKVSPSVCTPCPHSAGRRLHCMQVRPLS